VLAAIGILALTPPGFELSASEVYELARAVIEKETILEIAPFDVFSESMRQDAVRTCANDPACFLERFTATGTKIDLLLVASVADVDDQWLLGLRLVGAKGEDLGQLGTECDRSSFSRAMEDQLARLIPPSIWGQVGSIEAITRPAGARAELGARTCLTPCRFERVALGEQTIMFGLDGFEPKRETVKVTHEGARVDVVLAAEAEPDAWYESPWVWVGVGVGVVAASVGIFFIARGTGPDDVCITGDPAECDR
jgi:hypothetical protein